MLISLYKRAQCPGYFWCSFSEPCIQSRSLLMFKLIWQIITFQKQFWIFVFSNLIAVYLEYLMIIQMYTCITIIICLRHTLYLVLGNIFKAYITTHKLWILTDESWMCMSYMKFSCFSFCFNCSREVIISWNQLTYIYGTFCILTFFYNLYNLF